MAARCIPTSVLTLAHVPPGSTVEIRGVAGREVVRCPVRPGDIVQLLGCTPNTVRVRTADGRVLLIDAVTAALIRVETAPAALS